MKTIAYNDRQLEIIITDIYDQFNKNKSLQIEYRKPYKDKSLRQLGYIFGGLVDSVIEFYEYFGTKWNEEDVMDNFYNGAAYLDDRLIRKINRVLLASFYFKMGSINLFFTINHKLIK